MYSSRTHLRRYRYVATAWSFAQFGNVSPPFNLAYFKLSAIAISTWQLYVTPPFSPCTLFSPCLAMNARPHDVAEPALKCKEDSRFGTKQNNKLLVLHHDFNKFPFSFRFLSLSLSLHFLVALLQSRLVVFTVQYSLPFPPSPPRYCFSSHTFCFRLSNVTA